MAAQDHAHMKAYATDADVDVLGAHPEGDVGQVLGNVTASKTCRVGHVRGWEYERERETEGEQGDAVNKLEQPNVFAMI